MNTEQKILSTYLFKPFFFLYLYFFHIKYNLGIGYKVNTCEKYFENIKFV